MWAGRRGRDILHTLAFIHSMKRFDESPKIKMTRKFVFEFPSFSILTCGLVDVLTNSLPDFVNCRFPADDALISPLLGATTCTKNDRS